MSVAKQALGIFGGTFDPVHFGHLRSAVEVMAELQLAAVRLMPCRISPLRTTPRATDEQRLAMLNLAVAGHAGLQVDDRELRRPAPSYSVDSLRELRAELGSQQPLVLIMGQDAFNHFQQWRDWQAILTLAHLAVIQRPGASPVVDCTAYQCVQTPAALHASAAGKLIMLTLIQLDITATRLRTLAERGADLSYLLPDAVRDYVLTKHIYRGEKTNDYAN